MKSVRKFVLTFFTLTLLGSCVEPYSFNPGTLEDLLVVYGAVTDQPGPYVISLTQNGPMTGKHIAPTVSGAHITIMSDAGESEDLVEFYNGQYATASLQGVVGRTYTLRIVLGNTVYESLPEKMLPVGKFTNLHHKFVQNVSPFLNDNPDLDPNGDGRVYNPLSETKNGFNLIIDAELDPLPRHDQPPIQNGPLRPPRPQHWHRRMPGILQREYNDGETTVLLSAFIRSVKG